MADWNSTPANVRKILQQAPQRPINTDPNKSRLAEEAGIAAVQPLTDGMIDQSFKDPNRRIRAVEGTGADMITDRTAREDQRTRDIMEKLRDLMEDGDDPLMMSGKPTIPTQGQSRQRQPVMEEDDDDFIRPIRQQAPSGSWSVVDLMAKSKSSGAQIPVWKVQDEERGMEVPHTFRLEEAATMACEYLNQGLKDKAKSMVEMDKRRFELAKKARVLKESNSKPQYQAVMREIAQINTKLGL